MNEENIFQKGSTILSVRKGQEVVMASDNQLIEGGLILKSSINKIRVLGNGRVVAGYTGSMLNALLLFEKLESLVLRHPHQLMNACVELAKFFHQDPHFVEYDAKLLVVNETHSLILSGWGNLFVKEDGIIAIGAGGPFALAAAQALYTIPKYSAEKIVTQAMEIASSLCVYTNQVASLERVTMKQSY
jgi:ATP-dependent HslUV protease subunit HslV